MATSSGDSNNRKKQAFDFLNSEDSQQRRMAYEFLRLQAASIAPKLSADDWKALIDTLATERDPALHQKALSALLMLLSHRGPIVIDPSLPAPLVGTAEGTKENDAALLSEWIWKDFSQVSALFHAIDPDHLVRDEQAVIDFAFFFGQTGYPKPDIFSCSTADLLAHRALAEPEYRSFCVVGRPGLFGDKFLQAISLPPRNVEGRQWSATRFGFTIHRRPDHLPRIRRDNGLPAVDPDYNFLVEQLGDGTLAYHKTTEEQSQRVDWGVVQRYTVEISGKKRTVVIVAGASSLATLAAVKWVTSAAREIPMYRDEDLSGEPRMEALIRATADTGLATWEAVQFELVKLYVDKQMWDEGKWIRRPPEEVTVVGPLERPTDILIDRESPGLVSGRRMFTLTSLLVKSKLAGEAGIPIDDLLANNELFGEDNRGLVALDNLLGLLRIRYLSTALRITDSGVALLCKVRHVDSVPSEASSADVASGETKNDAVKVVLRDKVDAPRARSQSDRAEQQAAEARPRRAR